MIDPTPEQVAEAFRKVPIIPPDAVPGGSMGGNVICSPCWKQWLTEGDNWLAKPVKVVTIHKGEAMCQDHFREANGLPRSSE